jgi:YebC/PmpR family DNA-binding regulatory protein
MSGHSKWANIKHRKAKVDAQRGKIFTKLGRVIMAAARAGGGDPNNNLNLKLAIAKARESNMPMENIQRIIQRATGEMDGVSFEEVNYEGYASGGVAVLLQALTDNRNRTAPEIRHVFSRHGGALGEAGCVSWMFEMKGLIEIPKEGNNFDPDDLMLSLIEAGAEDVQEEEESVEVKTTPQELDQVRQAVVDQGISYSSADTSMVPTTTVEITNHGDAIKVLRLIDALEDNDDVQNVYANFDISDQLMSEIEDEL